jgi:hypothetical protein
MIGNVVTYRKLAVKEKKIFLKFNPRRNSLV